MGQRHDMGKAGVLGAVALAWCVTAGASAKTADAEGRGPAPAKLNAFVRGEMKQLGIPGLQLAVVRHGRIVFSGAYGVASVEDSVPVTKTTVFPINSITKAFTGVAAMELAEAGKLDLDAPVSTYLDGLPAAWRGITIRQLMTHTSGLPEIVDDNLVPIDRDGDEASWKKVQAAPVRFAPGTQFLYTQTNYLLLGKVIDQLAGEDFTRLVAQRQFQVAGMVKTSYGDSLDVTPHVARTYTHLRLVIQGMQTVGAQRTEVLHTRYETFPPGLRTAGGIQSTAEDLARWVIALQAGRFFEKPGSLAALWTPQRLKDGSYGGFSPLVNGYGLGWPVVMRARHRAIGPVGGERAAVFIYPDDDLAVVVLTNLMGASPQAFIDRIASFYVPDIQAVAMPPAASP